MRLLRIFIGNLHGKPTLLAVALKKHNQYSFWHKNATLAPGVAYKCFKTQF